MKKIIFAKLFELKYHQVLITKEDTEDEFNVAQQTDLGNVQPKLSLCFDVEKKRDKCFNDYNQENAEKFISVIKSMLE
jgi:hypothetical protein